MPPFDTAYMISYSTLTETMRPSSTVFDILSKVADFNLPHQHLTPPLSVTPTEFHRDLWHQKTRVPELLCGFVCVILYVAILVEHRLVTDTDTGL